MCRGRSTRDIGDKLVSSLLGWKVHHTLRIQVSPKEGISPIILFWGWDWNPQSYSREVSGFLGIDHHEHRRTLDIQIPPEVRCL